MPSTYRIPKKKPSVAPALPKSPAGPVELDRRALRRARETDRRLEQRREGGARKPAQATRPAYHNYQPLPGPAQPAWWLAYHNYQLSVLKELADLCSVTPAAPRAV